MAPNLHVFQETAVEAFPMAIVGFAVAFSVAKFYSVKHDYTIDGNQVRRQAAEHGAAGRSEVRGQPADPELFP